MSDHIDTGLEAILKVLAVGARHLIELGRILEREDAEGQQTESGPQNDDAREAPGDSTLGSPDRVSMHA